MSFGRFGTGAAGTERKEGEPQGREGGSSSAGGAGAAAVPQGVRGRQPP